MAGYKWKCGWGCGASYPTLVRVKYHEAFRCPKAKAEGKIKEKKKRKTRKDKGK